jgi:hypothetical protein
MTSIDIRPNHWRRGPLAARVAVGYLAFFATTMVFSIVDYNLVEHDDAVTFGEIPSLAAGPLSLVLGGMVMLPGKHPRGSRDLRLCGGLQTLGLWLALRGQRLPSGDRPAGATGRLTSTRPASKRWQRGRLAAVVAIGHLAFVAAVFIFFFIDRNFVNYEEVSLSGVLPFFATQPLSTIIGLVPDLLWGNGSGSGSGLDVTGVVTLVGLPAVCGGLQALRLWLALRGRRLPLADPSPGTLNGGLNQISTERSTA